jgi:hypothetical protein
LVTIYLVDFTCVIARPRAAGGRIAGHALTGRQLLPALAAEIGLDPIDSAQAWSRH